MDFAYGELTSGMTAEQQAEIDQKLDDENARYEVVEIQRRDGTVVRLSEYRLRTLRHNAGIAQHRPRRGDEV